MSITATHTHHYHDPGPSEIGEKSVDTHLTLLGEEITGQLYILPGCMIIVKSHLGRGDS